MSDEQEIDVNPDGSIVIPQQPGDYRFKSPRGLCFCFHEPEAKCACPCHEIAGNTQNEPQAKP